MSFRSRFATLLGAFALILLAAPCNARPQTPPGQEASRPAETFKIAGTVVNAITGASLSQARVSIAESRDPSKPVSLLTSDDGHFEFSSLKPGKYSLQGAKRGFLSAAYEQHEQYSTAIVTGPEFATENLVLRLTPMALMTGRLTDESGDPVRGATVILYFENRAGGVTRTTRFSTAHSDDRGFYDFSQLRPGKYFVSASAKPWYAVHPATTLDPALAPPSQVSSALDVAYPATYFNGATDADAATPIEVKGGDRLEIDLRLNPVPALHVFYRLPVAGDLPSSPGSQMPLLEKHVFDSLGFALADGTNLVAPGVFEMTGIPAGRYTVRMRNSDSGQLQLSSDVDLVQSGQDLSESRGEPLGALKITIKMPGDEPLPRQYGVGLQNSRRQLWAFRQGDPTGQFSFEDVPPGKYVILINSQAKALSVARTTSSAGESWGHDVTIATGAATDVTAFLSSGVVRIEGVVQKKSKKIAGVMVALVPNDPVAHIDLFRRDQSDFDGTFALQGVIPGAYTIVAVEDAWGLDWLQPSVLARYVQHGQNISIGDFMNGVLRLPDPIEVQGH
jgi:hypothetical protein